MKFRKKAGLFLYGKPLIPGWNFVGYHATDCPHVDDMGLPLDMSNGIGCAHYCEDCQRFVGRWISCGCVKVWCSDCWNKQQVGK